MKNLLIFIFLITATAAQSTADEIVSFNLPGYKDKFTMKLPSPFVTAKTERESENRKKIISSMNKMGGGQVAIVELYQTSWDSDESLFPSLSIVSTPKFESVQGKITEDMWMKMKQAYQSVSTKLFQDMVAKNLEEKKKEGMIPISYTKQDIEILFSSTENSVSFTAEAAMNMNGQQGSAFGYTKLVYAKQCIIMITLTVPTKDGIQSLSELVQGISVN